MKKILFQLITLFVTTFGYSQSCDLFFSEYLEGASNNKAIEVYNPLNAPVDLVDYKIFRYNNGSVTPTDSLQMLGTLAPGSVFVAGNPSAVAAILSVSDTIHTITFFNGDDALELRYMPTNTTLDVIGIIGNDPGVNWVVGTGATSEFTLVRQASIVNGETNWAVSVTEWDVYPQNTATFIGSHSGTPCCTNSFSSILTTACDSYTWPQTGQTYTTSGNYNDTIPNVTGCDSIITLMLTINSSTYSSQSITTCDSYTWPQTAQTYTISGNYNDTIPNVSGCDSIITLMLTINSSTYSSQSITACDSYTWPQTGQTYTTSGNYNDTIPNLAGCDSIITLMLTINSSTYSSQSITACDSYTWPQTAQTYTISGNYNDTIPNVAGCDSIITLILTIDQTPNSSATASTNNVLTAAGGSTFQWINCTTNQPINGASSATFTPTVNGTYAAIVGNGNACDDTTNCITISTIGLSEISNISIELHPNPTNDFVLITFDSNEAQVVIYDTQGKLIQTKTIHSGEQVSLKEVETGVYFFEVNTEKGRAVKRVVKG